MYKDMSCFVFRILLLLATASISASLGEAPRVSVNLDDAPRNRWTNIMNSYNDTIHASLTDLISKNDEIKLALEGLNLLLDERGGGVLETWFGAEQLEELEGIAAATAIPLNELASLCALYDMTAASHSANRDCTGVVVQNKNGEIFHGRNLDYTFPQEMEPLTAVVDFVRNGTIAYTSVSYMFMPAFNTVMSPGRFTLSHDERDQGNILSNWYELFAKPRRTTFSAIRDVADSAKSFEEALKMLSTVPLAADSYFILGGTKAGEGAVVTRNHDAPDDVWMLGENDKGTDSTWWVLETNYDHWKNTSDHDNRRAVAERFLNSTGQDAFGDLSTMLSLMLDTKYNKTNGERPVYNSETVYTAVMQAAHPERLNVIVHGTYPDPPYTPPSGIVGRSE